MKLTTAETKRYAELVAKMAAPEPKPAATKKLDARPTAAKPAAKRRKDAKRKPKEKPVSGK